MEKRVVTINEYQFGSSKVKEQIEIENGLFRPVVFSDGELIAEWDRKQCMNDAKACLDEFDIESED